RSTASANHTRSYTLNTGNKSRFFLRLPDVPMRRTSLLLKLLNPSRVLLFPGYGALHQKCAFHPRRIEYIQRPDYRIHRHASKSRHTLQDCDRFLEKNPDKQQVDQHTGYPDHQETEKCLRKNITAFDKQVYAVSR